jgi:G3E family GTPase
MEDNNSLNTIMISGFVGSGKTTLINHLLTESSKTTYPYPVVITHNSDLLNLKLSEGVVQLSKGCVCCSLLANVEQVIREVAREKNCATVFIEPSGTAEPYQMLEPLSEYSSFLTVVTVVDAQSFLEEYLRSDDFIDRGLTEFSEDTRNISSLLVDQVEVADILVINKIDTTIPEKLLELKSVLSMLNPKARLLECVNGAVDLKVVLLSARPAKQKIQLENSRLSCHALFFSQKNFGNDCMTNFTYESLKPFHPERLLAFFHNNMNFIYRSKGVFWLASRPDLLGTWSQAGSWIKVTTNDLWQQTIKKQHLFFNGPEMDSSALIEVLDNALLTDSEVEQGETVWRQFKDDLP